MQCILLQTWFYRIRAVSSYRLYNNITGPNRGYRDDENLEEKERLYALKFFY